MMELSKITVYDLRWNSMTTEAFNENKNEATLIFNFDITTEEKIKNVIQYVVGRTIWGHKNLPAKANIILSFDIRGQSIIMSRSTEFKGRILAIINNLGVDNQISIEFLR